MNPNSAQDVANAISQGFNALWALSHHMEGEPEIADALADLPKALEIMRAGRFVTSGRVSAKLVADANQLLELFKSGANVDAQASTLFNEMTAEFASK